MVSKDKKSISIIIVFLCLVLFSIFFFWAGMSYPKDDFYIKYNGKNYNVIVERPGVEKGKYPLVIYHHGGGYETLEPFELRKVAKRLAEEGFLVWIPERTIWSPERALETLSEADGISKKVLDTALNNPKVDKNNINLVGFCLGSWAILEENIHSESIKSISLIGFGAPFDDTVLYDRVFDLVNNTVYDDVSADVLVMVSKGDSRVNIAPAEILRQKMVKSDKKIDCMVYNEGDHLSMAGDKPYMEDLIKYLKGEEINTVDSVEFNDQIVDIWNKERKTGYW